MVHSIVASFLFADDLFDLADLFFNFAGSHKYHLHMACQQPEKSKSLESCFDNEGLDQLGSSVEESETICLASIFGGTSVG